MKSILKADLSRSIKSWRFLLAVFLMFLTWYLNSQRFGIKEDILYLFINIWGRSTTPLLAIVISSYGYAASYCEDVENHLFRYSILRTGLVKYLVSKILSCFCAAFLILTFGTLLFLISQSFSLPLVAENSTTISNFSPYTCFGNLLSSHTLLFFILQIFLFGLLCGGFSVLALAFSTFIKNSYGVFVIPFLLHYCFFYLFSAVKGKFPMLDIEHIYSCFSTYTQNKAFFLGYAFLVAVLFLWISFIIMYQRIKGEHQ